MKGNNTAHSRQPLSAAAAAREARLAAVGIVASLMAHGGRTYDRRSMLRIVGAVVKGVPPLPVESAGAPDRRSRSPSPVGQSVGISAARTAWENAVRARATRYMATVGDSSR